MTLDIKGKWALITGASRGVGQQIALGLAELGVELDGTDVLANMVDPGWCRTDLGGPDAFNDVETVLPGALIPAMLGKQGPAAPKGMMFAVQDYAGIKWP